MPYNVHKFTTYISCEWEIYNTTVLICSLSRTTVWSRSLCAPDDYNTEVRWQRLFDHPVNTTIPFYILYTLYQCRLQHTRPEFSSYLTENTLFEFHQSGAVTCKFSVDNVTNSWKQCRCSCLTGKIACLNLTNQGLLKLSSVLMM